MKVKLLPIAVTLASVIGFAGAVSYTSAQLRPGAPVEAGAKEGNQDGEKGRPAQGQVADSLAKVLSMQSQVPSVVVVEAKPSTYKALVTGYGEAVSQYEVTYSAEVSGSVKSLSTAFETGKLVKKGEVLAKLEDTQYQQAVAQAKSDLADAQLELLEEQRTGEQARLEWQRSGMKGDPSSPLVLREPQLAAAKAAVENAKYSLKKAEEDLQKTVIKAPFDALVVDRDIQPGSYVQTGGTLATLYSTAKVEIEIPLSAKQWDSLPDMSNAQLTGQSKGQWQVQLKSSDGNYNWVGYVARIEQHVDSTSRQRSLVVAVDKPLTLEHGLYPGTFVQAYIDGKSLENTWELPASAISQQGDIWFITEDNELNKVPADKLFERSESVYVSPIENLSSAQIIKRPLSSYVVGMKVAPKVEG